MAESLTFLRLRSKREGFGRGSWGRGNERKGVDGRWGRRSKGGGQAEIN